jgi:hypothetical protein
MTCQVCAWIGGEGFSFFICVIRQDNSVLWVGYMFMAISFGLFSVTDLHIEYSFLKCSWSQFLSRSLHSSKIDSQKSYVTLNLDI